MTFRPIDSNHTLSVGNVEINDAYAQIRNDVSPNTANAAALNMISMESNDIQTVNIPGLT